MSQGAEKLTRFMEGFAAASQLARRAKDLRQHVEFVCLTASLIDALLRIGLILRHQIDTKSTQVLEELLYQSETDRIIGEREIYRRALEKGVIDQTLFEAVSELYGSRNRVVHRYIISEITTSDVAGIAEDFAKMLSLVSYAIYQIEKEQLSAGVGMTSRIYSTEDPVRSTAELAAKKHGNVSRIILPGR